jgi:hypothetical protein
MSGEHMGASRSITATHIPTLQFCIILQVNSTSDVPHNYPNNRREVKQTVKIRAIYFISFPNLFNLFPVWTGPNACDL